MKVVALGGCGDIGRFAVRAALRSDFVTEMVIADRDGDRAAALAAQCGERARHAQVDVSDANALGKLLEGAHVVLNTTGPYFRFGVPVLRAALAARCHYLDVNDDWEPTVEMLALDGAARGAGVTAIIGMGASPGVSNLLAVRAMRELDCVEDVVTAWNVEAAQVDANETRQAGRAARRRGPSAASAHVLQQLTGTIRVQEDGVLADVRPLGEVALDCPRLAAGVGWTIGHPEPITLAHNFPQLRNSWNVMTGPRSTITVMRWMARVVNWRLLTAKRAAALLDSLVFALPAPDTSPARAWATPTAHGPGELPPLFALARGSRDGRPASACALAVAAPPGRMGGATGIPLAIGFELLMRGDVTKKGVLAPEAAIDPDAFFDALAPWCDPPASSGREIVRVTRSWDS